ncbi:molybdenum cofactor guanylyltransferase MobA [Pigmentiphaga humi]|nr:molybdenum cofactor guanylyltransferase MobA [Pigmentiphaga humi]
MIDKESTTGLVLAGGQGRRMGGVDKGWRDLRGEPLVGLALRRLAPQVGRVAISANRNLAAYAALGVPVWQDSVPGYAGPLAGMLTGLEQCATPYLAAVPCDTPGFPEDLVQRLAQGLEAADAEIAVAATSGPGGLRTQPVFCLMAATLKDSLARFLAGGGRRVDAWTRLHRRAEVLFEDAAVFAGANTEAELQRL